MENSYDSFTLTNSTKTESTKLLGDDNPIYYSQENNIHNEECSKKNTLKRNLTFSSCFTIVIGSLLGSGVFISPSLVAASTPNSFIALMVWVIAGLISLSGALCYCELVSIIRKTGSTYVFILEAYGKMPGFILLLTVILLIVPGVSNVMILTMGEYACYPFFEDRSSTMFFWISRLVGIAFYIIAFLITCLGAEKASRIQKVLNMFQYLILAMLIVAGVYHMIYTGDTSHFSKKVFFQNSSSVISNFPLFGTALFNALFCFDGWYLIAFFVEEIISEISKNVAGVRKKDSGIEFLNHFKKL